MKNILLVGGAGYIGSVLTDFLINKKKVDVTSIDNLMYSHTYAIKKFKKKKNYKFYLTDLRNEKNYIKLLPKFNAVIILAGLVGDPITKKYKKLSNSINLIGIKKFIKICKKFSNIERLIFISTCSNYGLSKKNSFFSETSSLRPLSIYAKQKVQIEKFLLQSRKEKNFNPCILRFATAFGLSPRMRFDLTVNHFVRYFVENKSLEIYDPNTWRPYCHVKDFARLIYKVLICNKKLISYQVFNAGSSFNNFRKIDIVNKIQKYFPTKKIEFKKNDIDKRNYRVNFNKVKKILKFNTKYSLDYGIKEISLAIKKGDFLKKKYQLGNYYIKKNNLKFLF